jgi:hypothetical protein
MWVAIVAVLLVGIEVYLHATGDVSTAGVGSCLTMNGDDGDTAKVVDCNAPDARYKIVGQATKKTEEENATQNVCDAYPSSEVQFWYGKKGEPGVIWCLAPAN